MKFFRIILAFLLVLCNVFTIFVGTKKIKHNELINKENNKEILTIWQIDTFEGGIGSRKNFLMKIAREFEKENNIFIMVVSHTKTSAEENMENGIYPDLISYGNGVNVGNLKEIRCDRQFNAGVINHSQYAIPWCRGGYVLIENTKKTNKFDFDLIISKNENNLPVISVLDKENEYKKTEILTYKDAFSKFKNGKSKFLLGTQRDLIKLNNIGMETDVLPLNSFNDLYQYISITCNNEIKLVYSEKFINFLISDEIQKKLSDICLFSPYIDISFDNDCLVKMQNQKVLYTVSPFIDLKKITEIHNDCLSVLSGDKNSILKIKNVLISC
ncbi:MAG: hypothetical protein MJ066_04035 [Clostridia bacterium]|nr:hypothetical protein [Clostridia bacterium]